MTSPSYDYYSPMPTSPLSTSTNNNRFEHCYSLVDRVRLISKFIDEEADRDLYALFVEIIHEIFGRGSADKGWKLDKLKIKSINDQRYICREPDCVFAFLCSNGNIFKLCYKLLSNSLLKFNVYFSDIPIELRYKIEKSYGQSYYGSRLLFHVDSNVAVGLNLNSFEYFMFHFALYGLKLIIDDDFVVYPNEQSVYKCLCLDYLNYFLPLGNSASMISPQLQINVLSSIPNQKHTSTSKLLNFIKKDVACNDMSSDKIESSSWVLTSEATWRSELVSFFFADIWLYCNASTVPSIELTKLIRCFLKHLHLYSNCAKNQPTDNLKSLLLARHSIKIYQYLSYYMDNWPQDFSFRLLLENWLCYIQPWRYEDLTKLQYSITENEMNNKWKVFIIRNLLCYTKLFYLVIKRFMCIDICSPRYSIMVFRTLKVFTHPYLLKLIIDIEHMYINNQVQNKKWNLLLSECFVEAEGPSFKYELMFSEERIQEYKLFHSKLQKSLNHVAIELNRFQEEKIDRNNSSMLGLILTPRRNKMSDYTLSEWEDIQTNLKSSFIFMEQIMNTNAVPMVAELSTWSISGISGNNTSDILNKSNSVFSRSNLAQSFERGTMNLSLRPTKEWEIDPDCLDTLSYENYLLVKLSKFLRNTVEFYWHSEILKFSTENTILAGVLRQTLIRAPMKIFSYEPRNDGTGKRVRTPKILPPTISFRWIASYYTLTWIVFLLVIFSLFNNTGIWIGLFYFCRIIFYCLKYLIGYSPPFKLDGFHEN